MLTNQLYPSMEFLKGDEESNVLHRHEEKEETLAAVNLEEKLESLSTVKSQLEEFGGWLKSNIPTFIKTEYEGEATVGKELPPTSEFAKLQPPNDDNYEDSTIIDDVESLSKDESLTDEKDYQFSDIQSTALAGAKSFGTFLYSAVNMAGRAISETGAMIKESIENSSLLSEFNREQEEFIKKQNDNASSAIPPWAGCTNEQVLKDECLSLSLDRSNFIRNPPIGVDFQFDYQLSYPVALSIMRHDPNLEKMRYELVPRVIKEEHFWRNYFYRISLICQANTLSFLSEEEDDLLNNSNQLLNSSKLNLNEFVSDSLQASIEDLNEIKEGMKKLSFKAKSNEEWQRELDVELQDYETKFEGKTENSKSDNWEAEIDDILQNETDIK